MKAGLGFLYGVIVCVALASLIAATAPSRVRPEFVECTMRVGSSLLTSKCVVTGAWHE